MTDLQQLQDALDDAKDTQSTLQLVRRGAAVLGSAAIASTVWFTANVQAEVTGTCVAALLIAMFCYPATFAAMTYLHYSGHDYRDKRTPSRWSDAKRAVRTAQREYDRAVAAETERIIRGML